MKIISKIKEKYNQINIQLKASFWFFVAITIQKLISVITLPIFTRIMSLEQFGEYSLYNSWRAILTVFITLNMSAGIYMRNLVKTYEDKKEEYTSAMLGLTIVVVLASFLAYILFASYWNGIFQIPTYLMASMFLEILLVAIYNFWASKQRVDYKYKTLVFITIFIALIVPMTSIILMYFFPYPVEIKIFTLIIFEFFIYGALLIISLKKSKKIYNKKVWIEALKYSIPLLPHYLSQTLLNEFVRIVIRDNYNKDSVAIYSLAYSISMLMLIVNTSIQVTLNPWIYQKIKENNVKIINKVVNALVIVVVLANLLVILYAPELVAIFGPPEYKDAAKIIAPLSISVFLMFLYGVFATFSFYYGKTVRIAFASIIGAVANILLNLYFIPKYGIIVGGYASLISYGIYVAMHTISMKQIIKQKHNNEKFKTILIGIIFVIFLGTSFTFTSLYEYFIIRIIIGVLILVGITLFSAHLIKNKKNKNIFIGRNKGGGLL